MSRPDPPASHGVRLASRPGRWVLAAAVLGSGMALLDGTVVNIALPRIGEDLGASLATLQWTVNGYLLTLAGLILLGGGLGDRYGRRRVFVVGAIWFALASALCGIAQDSATLIISRALQGVGGALLTPGSLSLVQATFRREDRAKAVGAWSGLGGVAGAVGPFIGGYLVDGPGWRWIFLINVPIAAVVVLIAQRHVPESRDRTASGSFDVTGAALAALCLAGITYALISASGHPSPLLLVGPAALGLACGVAFVRVEQRRAHPMLPLSVFSSRLFTSINLVTLLLYAAIGGVFFTLPVQLQIAAGYSALRAGIATLPLTLLLLLLSAPAGALAQRIGPRLLLTVGPLVTGIGLLLLTRIGPGASGYFVDVLPAVLVQGVGMSMIVAPLTATVLASVDVTHSGIASGVNNAAARVAQLLAVAALPLAIGLSNQAYRSPHAVDTAFSKAMWICAGLCAIAAVLALLLIPSGALREDDGDEPRALPECRTNCGFAAPPLEPGSTGSTRATG
ncbi:drug resistance transporter, EmrB/QacA subfamily [Streptomyces sp. DvalAA-14]|uniref:DHA2 family efflux MFS transporter permease subunit n=1 Tax=unclassified Streptomyces TaxID=2593676 RepID=UPI00081B7766|nr:MULTISPECIES: DHA2 family efflux MFS transporter permease subunit [unclassified Streptomyces]MYS23443.1 DHA2 family efflux MFS transporter permease subunit [Streptomyces sp. SID4948]SCE33315.1 drug resistance transporter, EmrB/QacA subfamily [Streptomyces sp. DvalAA-14]